MERRGDPTGAEPPPAVEDPRPGDPAHRRQVRERVEQLLFSRPPRPVTFGRYVLLDRIGAGGVGVVHAAYDPELDRKVAIKLLYSAPSGADPRAALLREAQALAQLAHPNVIAVYDVGTYGDDDDAAAPAAGERGVYMVMELVPGQDLSRWLPVRRPGWREVVRICGEAGRGLAAAHARGVIHRDFKPSNVLIGDDGRVRVVDFGLARAMGPSATSPEDRAGTVIGTPAYMAPEQHRGQAGDVASDVHAFCATLYAALTGRPAFAALDLAGYAEAKTLGPPAFGREPAVPRWVQRLVRRGLQPEPRDRFGSMDELLDALGRDPGRRARKIVLGAATAAGIAALGYAAVHERPSPCDDAGAQLAGVWDPATREAIATAFAGSSLPFAAESARSVVRHLEAYVQAWSGAWTEACTAALERDRSLGGATRRMLCLERRKTRLAGVTRLLREANPAVVERAVQIATDLPTLDECLGDRPDAPGTETLPAAVLEVEADLAVADARRNAGDLAGAVAAGDVALARAEALDDDGLRARVLLTQAKLTRRSGDFAETEALLRRALYAAETAGEGELALGAMIELVVVVGDIRSRPQEALHLAEHARARLPADGTGPLAARLEYHLGRVHERQGRFADAREANERALAEAEARLTPDHPFAIEILTMKGVIDERELRFADALAVHQRVLEAARRTYGEGHYRVGVALANVASERWRMGEYRLALAQIHEALRIFERSLGPLHLDIAWLHNNLAWHYSALGASVEAIEHANLALDLRLRVLDPEHPDIAAAHAARALALASGGHLGPALDSVELALRVRAYEPEHPDVASTLLVEGWLHRRRDDCARAEPVLHRGLSALQRHGLAEHHVAADGWLDTGLCRLDAGDPEAARAALERALEIDETGRIAAYQDAPVRLALAAAVRARDPARSRELERAALADEGDEVERRSVLEVAGWLARRGLSEGPRAPAASAPRPRDRARSWSRPPDPPPAR